MKNVMTINGYQAVIRRAGGARDAIALNIYADCRPVNPIEDDNTRGGIVVVKQHARCQCRVA